MQLGITAFEEMKKETPVSRNPELNALVDRVGRRIAAAASEDLPEAQWEFVLFEDEQANAFCLPGGKIGVFTGILPITQNEAGLAAVLGHEVAHASAHHGAERMSQALAAQTGQQFVGAAFSAADPMVQQLAALAYPVVAQVGVMLPYGRKQELEADHIGLIYMARAGYDPEEAIRFWERFSKFNEGRGGGGPAFLRTHPVDTDRIQQLRELMPKAKAEMQTPGNQVISSPAR